MEKKIFYGTKKGLNKKDLPSLINKDHCTRLENLFYEGNGILRKRKGITEFFELSGVSEKITMLKEYDNKIALTYGTTLAFYNPSDSSFELIKSDFSSSEPFSSAVYGDFLYICNGEDRIHVVKKVLDYKNKTTEFTGNKILTGATSGATAVLLQNIAGTPTTSGTLTLMNISGEFQDGEIITDSEGGSATVDGDLRYQIAEIAGSPRAKILFIHDDRLFAGNTSSNKTELLWSNKYSGSSVPFCSWYPTYYLSYYGGPGSFQNNSFGELKEIGAIGNQIVAVYDQGKAGFNLKVVNMVTSTAEVPNVNFQDGNFGNKGGIASTSKGIFYVNKFGVFQQTSASSRGLSFALGRDYFSDIDFSNSDLIYASGVGKILITCARDSSTNNLVLAYDVENDAWSEITGWNIERFINYDAYTYGSSALNSKVYCLFDGLNDNGTNIACAYESGEIDFDQPLTIKKSKNFYAKGRLHSSSSFNLKFDIWDKKNKFIENKLSFTWNADADSVADSDGLKESFAHSRIALRNYLKAKIKFTEESAYPLEINFMALDFEAKKDIKKSNI